MSNEKQTKNPLIKAN